MIEVMALCLALNLHHEARGEKLSGQIAVSEVVRNRMASSKWPSTACAVVWQPMQFSWTTEYKHKPMNLTPYLWIVERSAHTNYAQGADHYHTIDIMPPDWTDDMEVVQVIGNHIFYRS